MPANRTQSARVGCAVLLLLSLVGGIFIFTHYQDMTSCHTDRPPLISIGVTIDPSQGQQFVEQSRQFAFKHNFRFDIDYDEQGDDFHVRMIRKDVEIIARSPFNPGGYEIGFYNYDCIHPIVASDIADLVNDFKSFMSEIPNVTITEAK
jgi:hypothetical protein